MYDFWVQFTKQLFALIAVLWMVMGMAFLLAAQEYPVTAIGMNAVSVIGVVAYNALQSVRSKSK